jgi:hypothetical protein
MLKCTQLLKVLRPKLPKRDLEDYFAWLADLTDELRNRKLNKNVLLCFYIIMYFLGDENRKGFQELLRRFCEANVSTEHQQIVCNWIEDDESNIIKLNIKNNN